MPSCSSKCGWNVQPQPHVHVLATRASCSKHSSSDSTIQPMKNKTSSAWMRMHIHGHVSCSSGFSCPYKLQHNTTRIDVMARSLSQNDVSVNDDENMTRIRAEVTRRIKNLGRQGKVKDAIKELANMARMGVQPDTLSATALVDACVKSNKIEMAENVFDELFGELLVPDEVAFMVLIRGYGDEYPPRWTSIATMLSTMEHTYGIVPTVLTFNTLLEVCSKTNDEERGVEIIDRMQDAGVVPNDMSFEAVRQRKSLRSMLKKLV